MTITVRVVTRSDGRNSVRYENPYGDISAITIDYRKFVERCAQLAHALDDCVNSISINFVMEVLGPRAEIAWRNEVFAILASHGPWRPDSDPPTKPFFLSDPDKELIRDRQCTEDELRQELPVLLKAHLECIIRKHEERVRYAREALSALEST